LVGGRRGTRCEGGEVVEGGREVVGREVRDWLERGGEGLAGRD